MGLISGPVFGVDE